MKIAITGCNGAVGRHVVSLALKSGHKVHGIDINERVHPDFDFNDHIDYTFEKADLRDYPSAVNALRGTDAVVHLAAFPFPDENVVTHNTNVVLSWNVLRAAVEVGIKRIVQASSVNVIRLVLGIKPKVHYLPLDEDHPCEPDEPYGLSKVICETQADAIVAHYTSTRIASLRLGWVIPEKQHAVRVGPPDKLRDGLWGWTSEHSAALAFLKALESEGWEGHEAFFVVAPDPPAEETTEQLYRMHWKHVPIKKGGTVKLGFFNCEKAKRLLKWEHV
ncbi:NAD(P)-binding protein [Trametopsis cervina]|nr:NAD(P)-binding protein [Trametopsis cervina]